MKYLNNIILVVVLYSFFTCTTETPNNSNTSEVTPIFKQLSVEESGVDFANNLKEDSVINYFTYPYIYMGGGVAVGDVNNDGLQDLYFTGNMTSNKLFLNKGNMKFEDITAKADVGGDERWITGVTMADVNADGWIDIYVSVSGKFATTKNLLYVNNGIDENGIPTFTEKAEEAGIADDGHSTQGTFFDYDKDGDLDLYVANYPYTSFKTINFAYAKKIYNKEKQHSDKLYKNNGDGTFVDVTEEAGVLNFGLSLSATVGDFNKDGWEDLYVSNDFATPDIFYFNNGDGTFSDKIKETTQHTAYFGMGADVSDFNNDGLLDILQMDMTPQDNRRNKANMASMNPTGFWEIVNMGMHYQYMQNALQLNNGIGNDSIPHFSDVARIAGMASTDWSWAGLMADLDNDGWKDIFITNGTRRDINNKDYFKEIGHTKKSENSDFDYLELTLDIPSEQIDNFAFKNNGDLTFTNVVKDWGLSFEGFSNGAAYADLDNDGDLDVVINNIDAPAVVYQNKSSDLALANYLAIKLNGNDGNQLGLGTKVTIKHNGQTQYQEHTLTRGFQSSVDPVIHFGIGKNEVVDEIEIVWPDGKIEKLNNIAVNQILELDYTNAKEVKIGNNTNNGNSHLFTEVTKQLGIDYNHIENEFNDFQHQVLLPHTYSRNGPGLAVGDVNGDGLEDFFIGGAINKSGVLYIQNQQGSFDINESKSWELDMGQEDMGATFFDADADGDLDLYVVSGGNEFPDGDKNLKDRLYINNGKGGFEKAIDALPEMLSSGSRVKAADYDNDGDLDLFVGGRLVPRSYPLPAKSFILRNESSTADGKVKFVDVTAEIAPDLLEAGLVTDAVWVDYNLDSRLDLVVVGEWMPITVLENNGDVFSNETSALGLENSTGWWYSIVAEDFDQDGDLDFVAGNLGLNYKYQATPEETFDVYVKDYDRNGSIDIVLGYYNDGTQYPVRGKQCSSEQIPNISIKYSDYNSFADASLEDIYSEGDLETSLHYKAKTFASSYIENKGEEGFVMNKLPNEVQISSINGMVVDDFNSDGLLDVVVAGNLYGAEVETTRNDASYGSVMIGDGKGNFSPIPFYESGFYLKHDTKELDVVNTVNGKVIIAANNNDLMKALILN